MIYSVRGKRDIVEIYNGLINQASRNLGKKIKVEWGTWVPTELGIKTLISRRDKLTIGV